jgi:GalNAc-alpha-(1->4)-GalNAc-alpha-(1->3)-diNAcBac-PP-undecaprenol alpha-1,4-N-acetyl-D-galactosaminyltransferase
VVAFDCTAGPSEMITDGVDGFLVPLHDFGTFERKLLSLMNDISLAEQLGNQAKRNIKRFSPDRIGEEYFTYITSKN